METETLDDNYHNNIRNVQYAGFGQRFLAYILDFMILIVPIAVIMYFGFTQKSMIILVAGGIASMLYKPLMEGIYGATLGKMIVKIKVVDSNLDQVDLGESFVKNAIFIISGIIAILGNIWLAGTEAFQESEGFMEASMAGQDNPYNMYNYIWMVVILISCFAMFASDVNQTLHDRLANTFCVKNSTFDQ